MEPIYSQKFLVDNNSTDRFGRMKPSAILSYVQEVAGNHFDILDRSLDSVNQKGLFWAGDRLWNHRPYQYGSRYGTCRCRYADALF